MISHDINDYYLKSPNFSICVPGVCNAACKFCYNKGYVCNYPNYKYLKSLENVLNELPDFITQVSITGYEPTISPIFTDVLNLVHDYNFNKVVLNTNGAAFIKYTKEISRSVDYVNLSRHHYQDNINKLIFGGMYKLTTYDIDYICGITNTTLVSIIDEMTPDVYIDLYLDYALEMNASAVTFRQLAGNIHFLPIVKTRDCVETYNDLYCREINDDYFGLPYKFKASVLNPGKECDKIYELIFKQDGVLDTKWGYLYANE